MATTWTELKAEVAEWLARDDLTTVIPTLITFFEAYANRTLRVRQMEITDDLTPSGGEATLPTPRRELEYVNPSYLQAAYPDDSSGYPNVFTIEGETIIIRPTSTTDLELSYFQKIPVLSGSNATNWLLTAHPDAYLYGSLCEAQGLNVDFDKMLLWKQRRDEVMAEIERLSAKSRGVGAVRIMGPVV
jgi:hypothetical protein